MAVWTFYDYVEVSGRNPIRDWLCALPGGDQAKIDYRLQQMAGMSRWPEKWVSKYQGTDEIFELRITGNKIQYRPLGTYFGAKQFLLLNGAIEKGDKIPKSDIETAIVRLAAVRRNLNHVRFHEECDEQDMEEDG
jgi:phage-related protein